MLSLRQLVSDVKARPKAHLALAFVLVSNQITSVALAAAPPSALISVQALHRGAASCVDRRGRRSRLAAGMHNNCARCRGQPQRAVWLRPVPGVRPRRRVQNPGHGRGARTWHRIHARRPGPMSSRNRQLHPQQPRRMHGSAPAPVGSRNIGRSWRLARPARGDPQRSDFNLAPERAGERIELDAGNAFLQAGDKAVLTATANATVTGTNSAIEIFDTTTHTLAGACTQSSQCIVAYAATSGLHTFAAFITPPGAALASARHGACLQRGQRDLARHLSRVRFHAGRSREAGDLHRDFDVRRRQGRPRDRDLRQHDQGEAHLLQPRHDLQHFAYAVGRRRP